MIRPHWLKLPSNSKNEKVATNRGEPFALYRRTSCIGYEICGRLSEFILRKHDMGHEVKLELLCNSVGPSLQSGSS